MVSDDSFGLTPPSKSGMSCDQVEEPHSVAAAALKRNTIPLGEEDTRRSEQAGKREH